MSARDGGGGGGENRTLSWLRFSWRQVAPPEGLLLGLAPRSKNAAQPLLIVKKPLFDRPTAQNLQMCFLLLYASTTRCACSCSGLISPRHGDQGSSKHLTMKTDQEAASIRQCYLLMLFIATYDTYPPQAQASRRHRPSPELLASWRYL